MTADPARARSANAASAMNAPRNHHYLPRFYLDRWATNAGRLYRYARPRGSEGKLHCELKTPAAIGYKRDLYQLPDIADPIASQSIELEVLQQIDDRAATALRHLDCGDALSSPDREAVARFIISLLHRSPTRLAAIRKQMENRPDAPFATLYGADRAASLRASANRLLAMLTESKRGAEIISKFAVHKLDASRASRTLLTSDRPITVSALLVARDAFILMPYGPTSLILLTNEAEIVRAFRTQRPNALVTGINQAIVEQSQEIVIAADRDATKMIERLFLRGRPEQEKDTIGLIRRRSPFTDLSPKVRSFSRHDKRKIGDLGE